MACKQFVVLGLVRIVFSFFIKLVQHFAFAVYNSASTTLYASFGTYNQFIYLAHCTGNVAALAVEFGAIRIFKLYKMVVKDFTVVFAFAHLPAAHALRTYGVSVFKPAYCI